MRPGAVGCEPHEHACVLLDARESPMITLTIVLRVGQLGAATLLVGTWAWRLVVVRPLLPHIEQAWSSTEGTPWDSRLRRLRAWSLLGLLGCGVLGLWVHPAPRTNQSLG